uniref:Uncharacterized protein n=1 Tax=Strongyloides venezuelensis TaxID=75913 RepID=A0A0K0G4J7_STRVS
MCSYKQTISILRFLFCVIVLLKVISGESYDNFIEENNLYYPLPMEKKKDTETRELVGKRSNQIGSTPYFFGRHSRRGRELFGKRSFPVTSLWDFPGDHMLRGFYNKRTRARELLGKRSEMVNKNNMYENGFLQNDKRRARELLGKRSHVEPFQIATDNTMDDSDESYYFKPQFENFIEVKRGRTRELFGK